MNLDLNYLKIIIKIIIIIIFHAKYKKKGERKQKTKACDGLEESILQIRHVGLGSKALASNL